MNPDVSTQKKVPEDSLDLTPRERKLVSSKWVIVSYDGAADATSASDTEDGAWDLFLAYSQASKEQFLRDGWKAVKMP